MKNSAAAKLTLLVATVLAMAGCESSPTVVIAPPQRVELRYDADNANAPNLPPATYEAAARFTPAQTAALAGGRLIEVEFYIFFLPASATLKIYDAGTPTAPGALLYSADVTAGLAQNAWTTHVLSNPPAISGGDLWISVEFTHAVSQRTIGCDPGPAVPDGDWLYSSTDGMWIPFNQRFAVSVNWNVRGIVEI